MAGCENVKQDMIGGRARHEIAITRPRAGIALQPMTKRHYIVSSTLAGTDVHLTRTRPRQRSHLESAHSTHREERSDHDPESGGTAPEGVGGATGGNVLPH